MKKLLIESFVFVFALMLCTSAFATSYNITEYCGKNGLINRGNGETHFQKGDVLNVSTPTIVQNGVNRETLIEDPEYPNLILSDGITINGNGATFDGYHYNGFIMVSSQGATVESTINNATLTNYGNNQEIMPIICITASTGTANSYAKLTLKDVNIETDEYQVIMIGKDIYDVNTELNIVSSEDVKMSSTVVYSLGKLNFKGNDINIEAVGVLGKVVNDSNLTLRMLQVGSDFDMYMDVQPKTITGEFTNNKTLTIDMNGHIYIVGSKFNNSGTITVKDGDIDIVSFSTFENSKRLNAKCINVTSSSIFTNTGSVDINEIYDNSGNGSGVNVTEDSVFNNKGKMNITGYLNVSDSLFNNDGTMTIDDGMTIGSLSSDFNSVFNNNGILKSTNVFVMDSCKFNNYNQWTADGKIDLDYGQLNNIGGNINANRGFESDGIINNIGGTINLGGDSSEFYGNFAVINGTVNLLKGAKYFNSQWDVYGNGTLNLINNGIDEVNLSKLTIYGTMKLNIDVNLELLKEGIDFVSFGDIYDGNDETQTSNETPQAKISLNKINLLSDAKSKYTIYVFGENAEKYIELASSQKKILGHVFTYKVSYGEQDKSFFNNSEYDGNNEHGNYNPAQYPTGTGKTNLLQFERLGGGDGETDLTSGKKINGLDNPLLLQSKVAIAASNISQEEVFDTIFNNAENHTFFQKQGTNAGEIEDKATPTMWIKAFGSQEDVDMQDYTKVKTTYYGAVVGLDWGRQYSDNFDVTYGIFASYIGGEFKDEDWSESEGIFKVKQNGGYAGLRANWHIGKLFINGIADYGMLQNDADNPYKSNDFNSQVIGLAARLGYNVEVSKRRFTIQPSVGLTGKYILTDDFETELKNGKEIKEETSAVTNITIEPGLKMALNLGKCWTLTGEGKYVAENFDGDTKVKGEGLDFILPDVSYKNYTSVGLGIEKLWGYTVLHLKGNKTFGGREGFVVNAGIEFKF